jgi:hypothetical protein
MTSVDQVIPAMTSPVVNDLFPLVPTALDSITPALSYPVMNASVPLDLTTPAPVIPDMSSPVSTAPVPTSPVLTASVPLDLTTPAPTIQASTSPAPTDSILPGSTLHINNLSSNALPVVNDMYLSKNISIGLFCYAIGSTCAIVYLSVIVILYYKRIKHFQMQFELMCDGVRLQNSHIRSESFQSVNSF